MDIPRTGGNGPGQTVLTEPQYFVLPLWVSGCFPATLHSADAKTLISNLVQCHCPGILIPFLTTTPHNIPHPRLRFLVQNTVAKRNTQPRELCQLVL